MRLAGKPSGLRVLFEGAIVVAAYAVVAIVLMAPLFSDLGGATLDPRRAWLSGWYAASDHDVQAESGDGHGFSFSLCRGLTPGKCRIARPARRRHPSGAEATEFVRHTAKRGRIDAAKKPGHHHK